MRPDYVGLPAGQWQWQACCTLARGGKTGETNALAVGRPERQLHGLGTRGERRRAVGPLQIVPRPDRRVADRAEHRAIDQILPGKPFMATGVPTAHGVPRVL